MDKDKVKRVGMCAYTERYVSNMNQSVRPGGRRAIVRATDRQQES